MSSLRRVYHPILLSTIAILGTLLIWNIYINQQYTKQLAIKQTHTHPTLQDELYDAIRILCLIPYNYKNPSSAQYVKRTWGKHCNYLVFVSGNVDAELEPYVPIVNATDNWTLVHRGLLYAYTYYHDKVDWFLKVEESSFVALENLRYLIHRKQYKPTEAIYFGYELKDANTQKPYVYCKSGYVISNEALRLYAADPDNEHCEHKVGIKEDLEIVRCLQHAGVASVDSRDEWGKETFLPIHISHQFAEGYSPWLRNASYHKVDVHTVPISQSAITFRLDFPPHMFNYYYFVYTVKLFGLPRP
ncbi:uncharacterized protein Dwil_GK27259 [Drosophila willistoni]|uniref:N-acetylgalactosaminide beta-1,3-galactosyltransferase n=1 Tax=Drosophila willistoni TaxID=7260 RepID=A0A0Q9WZE4_DROWI|nr:glycoprotein-N-acetylgalactosamine 3-beta-galactosyltransferase 1 [Drosophila willistoni]KRF98536.1 uncharacterized protein Dwil_GK27259 [Drosophila willistoni]